ncbi:hypothetical protein [Methanobrevibacter cuticularis]|nr:hypothetical protein [Methanobrevibacter cuticularis]
MKKKLIILFVLLATVAVSGCINSPLDNINPTMLKLSQDLASGNTNYNDAVKYVNSHNYNTASEKIKVAVMNFNDGQNKILEINNYKDDINDTVYLEYIDLVNEELKLKQDATTNLQLAIQFFEAGDNVTANSYVRTANDFMKKGVAIQQKREILVNNHPNKFQSE